MKFIYCVILIPVILAICSSGLSARDKPLIVLAGDNNLPPFEYLDSKGSPRGLVVDIVKEISKELGIPSDELGQSLNNA